MDREHINRVLNLLRNPERSFMGDAFWIKPNGQTRSDISRTKWKWFLRDIGKQSCVIGLLPFVEVAKHIRHTPLVESSYPARKHDDDELFDMKAALISEWVRNPSKENKERIRSILTPANHHLKYDLFTGGSSPNEKSTAFVNWLLLIILENRHFQNRVFSALACVAGMGYNHWFISLAFQKYLYDHYEQKLHSENAA